MTNSTDTYKESLSSLDTHERLSIARRIEALSWARPLWNLVAEIYYLLIERLLDCDERPTKRRRIHFRARAMRAKEKATFGRPLTYAMKAKIHRIRAVGTPCPLVRDAVIGRVLMPDGSIDLKSSRRNALILLGTLWHLIVTVSGTLLLLVAIFLPGPPLAKAVVAAAILAHSVLSIAFMNAITIRPALAFRNFVKLRQSKHTDHRPDLSVVS